MGLDVDVNALREEPSSRPVSRRTPGTSIRVLRVKTRAEAVARASSFSWWGRVVDRRPIQVLGGYAFEVLPE